MEEFCNWILLKWMLLSGVVVIAESCNVTARDICRELIGHHFVQQADSQGLFPQYDDTKLTRFCRALGASNECTKYLKYSCNISGQRVNEGVTAASEFLCGEGYSLYRETRGCYASKAIKELGKRCNSTYHDSLIQLQVDDDRSLETKQDLLCKYMDDLVTCLYDGIKQRCGSQAADWMKTLKSLTLSPARQEINCQDEKWKPVSIFGIMLGAFITVSLSVVVCLLYSKRRLQGSVLSQYDSVVLKRDVVQLNSAETKNAQIQHSTITNEEFLCASKNVGSKYQN